MEMNVRERLNDHRPYWKVVVSLAFSLLGTVLFAICDRMVSFIYCKSSGCMAGKAVENCKAVGISPYYCSGAGNLCRSDLSHLQSPLERDYSFNRGFPIHVSGSGSGIQSNRGEDIAVF